MPSDYERACEIVGCSGGEWEFSGQAMDWLSGRYHPVKVLMTVSTTRCVADVGHATYAGNTTTQALTAAVLAVNGENDAD